MSEKRPASVSDYDIYDRGYLTGSSTSIFIGPIWVEEAISVSKDTGVNKRPVYPYSDPYYSRLLTGRYIVNGTIAIVHTVPDYLLRILEEARSISITDDALEELIGNRRSMFLNTLSSKFLGVEYQDAVGDPRLKYLEEYVERIPREIELQNSERGFDPQRFELTIIKGNPYDGVQSLDIYEDCEITATGETIMNDDQILVDLYRYTGRKKPSKMQKIRKSKDRGIFVRSNLLAMARQLADEITGEILQPPTVNVFNVSARTGKIYNTNSIGVAGLLSQKVRFFGKRAVLNEVVYSFEYPESFLAEFVDKEDSSKKKQRIELLYRLERNGGFSDPITARGSYLSFHQDKLSNRGGRVISIDKERTVPYISAVAPILSQPLGDRLGGSIVLPRYRENEFYTGSFSPPAIITPDQLSYTDEQLDMLTAGTLWCSSTGIRSTGRDIPEGETDKGLLKEMTKPLSSIAYVREVLGVMDDEVGNLLISYPLYLDYLSLESSEAPAMRAEAPLPVTQDTDAYIRFGFDASGPVLGVDGAHGVLASRDGIERTDSRSSLTKESMISVVHQIIDADDLPSDPGDEDISFLPFSITSNALGSTLASDFDKCLYVRPYIFLENGNMQALSETLVHENDPIHGTIHRADGETQSVLSHLSRPSGEASALAYFLSKRKGSDDSCSYDITFDWMVKDVTTYSTAGQALTIEGIYRLDPVRPILQNGITCREDGCGLVPLNMIFDGETETTLRAGKIHVFWLLVIAPIYRGETTSDNSSEGVTLTHDISLRSGRRVEFYNFTRCDVLYHDQTGMMQLLTYSQEDFLLGIIPVTLNAIWTLGYNAFVSFINTLAHASNGLISTGTLVPLWKSMERISAFIRGYAFSVDVKEIADQIANAELKGVPSSLGSSQAWTLKSALATTYDQNLREAVAGNVESEIYSIVYDLISQKIEEKGATILEDPNSPGLFYVETGVITPSPSVVKYGLSAEGYADLMNTRRMNSLYESGQQTDSNRTFTLGSYPIPVE